MGERKPPIERLVCLCHRHHINNVRLPAVLREPVHMANDPPGNAGRRQQSPGLNSAPGLQSPGRELFLKTLREIRLLRKKLLKNKQFQRTALVSSAVSATSSRAQR